MPVPTMLLLKRPLTRNEARRVAERQSRTLIKLLGGRGPSVDIERISELDAIIFDFLPPGELSALSGATDWINGRWVISLNETDDLWEARFTVAHEFKHILDDPLRELLYPASQPNGRAERDDAEAVADYFAGCVLVAEHWLRQAWARGVRDISQLAHLFNVTEQLIETRLLETGLITPWPGVGEHHYRRLKMPHIHGWQEASRRYLARERAVVTQRLAHTFRPPSQARSRGLRQFSSTIESIEYLFTGIDQCPKGDSV